MPALAITDHGNMFGAVEFYTACKKAEIKPIIGCEMYVAMNGSRHEKTPANRATNHLTLFAESFEGYKNLIKLVSAGSIDGFYYTPRIDKELMAQHAKGIVCASGCLKGEVSWHLRDGNYNLALKAADEHMQIFGKDNYYIEIMDHGVDIQREVNEGLVKIAKELDVPVIATNDVHYLEQAHAKAHEALLCIQTQTTLDDPKRMRMNSDQYYFKSAEEMSELFSWCPEAVTNTVKLADRCNFDFDFDTFHMPIFVPPGGKSQSEYLRDLCEQGIIDRYGKETPEIRKRLEYEFSIIESMGFVSYFIIVWDFINHAKEQGIPVGPGRGSAAGSIVSYLIGITDLCPLHYGLLFERFLNPDRAGMPDIDIDFCYERRPEVIEYVNDKYGKENVAQIITFGTLQARAAIRDVGRAMGASYGDVDKIAKLIPNDLGITISEAIEKEPQIGDLMKADRQARDIIEMARTLEGLNRHTSMHAAGVVIADKNLVEYCPLAKTNDGHITTGFSMKWVAEIGLLKMDFLGLRTLTVIDDAIKLIKERHDVDIDPQGLPLDDQKTYAMLTKARSFGVFQLESAGMRDLLKKVKPSDFEDIISILALYRPGPMGSGMLDDFIQRKNGLVNFEYDHPKLEPILKDTYGIIIYQEQVMQIPVALAGFTLTQADHLRRAMSKKIRDVMDRMRVDFVKGCQEHSQMSEEKANYLFDLIDYFSGYGFNRSHSAAYAFVTFQTAYLKANYPVEFMCAILNSELNNTDKVVEYVKECEAMGIRVLPPDINESFKEFHVVDNQTIRFGLLAVKNVGSSAIDAIVEAREDAHYESLQEVCDRVDLRQVNKKVFESLIKSGAADSLKGRRSQKMAVLERCVELGNKNQKEKASGQVSFFDMMEDTGGFDPETEKMPNLDEWEDNQKLSFEKEVLGFYVSGHPLAHYQVEIKEFTNLTSKSLVNSRDGSDVRLVGMISAVKLTNTRKTNERMAIIRIEDMEGEVEAVIFPSDYVQHSHQLISGEVVFVNGKVNIRDDRASIIISDIKRVQDVYDLIKAINVDLSAIDDKHLGKLKTKLTKYPGRVPVYLNVHTNAHKSVQILVGEDLHVSPNESLMNEIKSIVGKENFSVTI